MFYVLREGLCVILEEGLEERFVRYCFYEKVFVVGIKVMGLFLFGDEYLKVLIVICVLIFLGIDGEVVCFMFFE